MGCLLKSKIGQYLAVLKKIAALLAVLLLLYWCNVLILENFNTFCRVECTCVRGDLANENSMGNWPPCYTDSNCAGQAVGVNLMFWMMVLTFVAPCVRGGYVRFCTAAGRKLAARRKREKDARKDSRKISIEVGQPKR